MKIVRNAECSPGADFAVALLAATCVASCIAASSSVVAAETPAPAAAGTGASPQGIDLVLETYLKDAITDLFSTKSDNLQLKFVEPDSSGQKSGWGVDYNWKYTKAGKPSAAPADGQPFVFGRMNFDLDIKGSYVFDDVQNNQDLSTITAALRLEHGDFGTLHVFNQAISTAFQNCLIAIPAPTADAGQRAELDREFDRCIVANGIDKMVKADPGASYYWVDFHGGVEANQNYSDTRTVFGLTGAYTYQPSARSAGSNFFDRPFQFLRERFSGASDYVAPFPSVLLGVERLDAKDDDTRTALTTKTTFTRAKAEVAFNTEVAQIGGQIVRFNVSYRYFHEFSAPAAIKAAGFDKFDFVTASLRFPARLLPLIESSDYELFVNYTNGRLPFSPSSDKAYEMGFATNIKTLADLLAR